jgi:lipoprotein-releasing system ATP-binding protein
MGNFLTLHNIFKSYGTAVKTTVLKDITLSFEKGEFAAIIGQSGSGKTTLLNMIGILDRPDSGETHFEGKNLYSLADDDLARFRSVTLGFVFQFHYLLPEYSAIENVLLPYRIAHGRVTAAARKTAEGLLERMGVTERRNNRSTNLSGGQQQRVAIARALMNKPQIILADEPTGNLDSDSGVTIRNLMREINKEFSTTFIVVTHDRHIAAACDRVIEIEDGKIVDDLKIEAKNETENWNRLAPCYCRLRAEQEDQKKIT